MIPVQEGQILWTTVTFVLTLALFAFQWMSAPRGFFPGLFRPDKAQAVIAGAGKVAVWKLLTSDFAMIASYTAFTILTLSRTASTSLFGPQTAHWCTGLTWSAVTGAFVDAAENVAISLTLKGASKAPRVVAAVQVPKLALTMVPFAAGLYAAIRLLGH